MAGASRSAAALDPPLDGGMVAAAAREAAAAAASADDDTQALDAAVNSLSNALPGTFVSVFVLEHGRLWLVSQRGYSIVPDGLSVESGILGRAVRLRRAQVVQDVHEDHDYIAAVPAVASEVAVPLRVGSVVVGALNVESERRLPRDAARLLRPLTAALAPRAEALRTRRVIDLAALARLFVYLGSLRDADEIAALAAATLAKVLPVDVSQVVLWDDDGAPVERAAWRGTSGREPLTTHELEGARSLVDHSVVCQVLGSGRRGRAGSVVWLPLRANGEDLGALVGLTSSGLEVEASQLDTAALLAAHVAATLDAAVALRRERRSAQTDPLTGILNRRGFEEKLESALVEMQERRMPLSLMLIDCDDFKEINDRAGHEFGDALLVEVGELLERLLPGGAVAARLGGDEFIVMLPEAGADAAEGVGARLRAELTDGMTDAGFPMRISAGISTFPFDGAGATTLIRAADQALYAAKNQGKDRIASFRDVVTASTARSTVALARTVPDRRGGVRTDGSVLAEALAATRAIGEEPDAEAVCKRLCKALVFVVGATACLAARIDGEFLVDATEHSLRDVSLGPHAAYRTADFPLTVEVLESGDPHAMSLLDAAVDPAEAFILRELSMNALLMLPLRVGGRSWGLVEVYEMRLRRFTDDDIALARFLVESAERRLEVLDPDHVSGSRLPLYELPPETGAPRSR
jgi:diguanylate cyclase (GGDEF)-like protein